MQTPPNDDMQSWCRSEYNSQMLKWLVMKMWWMVVDERWLIENWLSQADVWRKYRAVFCVSKKIPVTMIWNWYCPTLATMAESQQLLCLENDVSNFCNLCPFVVLCVHASFEHKKTWRHLGLPQSRMLLTLMVQWDTLLKQACWLM